MKFENTQTSGGGAVGTSGQRPGRLSMTPITAQRYFMGQQSLKQQKLELLNKGSDFGYRSIENQKLPVKTLSTKSNRGVGTVNVDTLTSSQGETSRRQTFNFQREDSQKNNALQALPIESTLSNHSFALKNNNFHVDEVSPYSFRVAESVSSKPLKPSSINNTMSQTTITLQPKQLNQKRSQTMMHGALLNKMQNMASQGQINNGIHSSEKQVLQLSEIYSNDDEQHFMAEFDNSQSHQQEASNLKATKRVKDIYKLVSRPQTSVAKKATSIGQEAKPKVMTMNGGFRRPISSYKKANSGYIYA